jgi:WD40 repeat protein
MRAAANAPAVIVLLILLMPAVGALGDPAAEKLQSPTSLNLRAISWRPVPGDSYALIAGESGTLLQYTGRFFINLSPNLTAGLYGIGWHPSGSSALIVGENGTVLLFNGQQVLSMPQNSTHVFEDVKWRPQGDFALIAGHNGTLFRYAGGAFTRIHTNISQPITSIAWRPDGRIALLCGDFPFVLRYDPETDSVLRLETGSDRYFLRYAAWRPDGAAALVMGTLGILFRYDGTDFVPLDSPTGNQWLAASWSPDNRTALL